jgi:hypothetical protein
VNAYIALTKAGETVDIQEVEVAYMEHYADIGTFEDLVAVVREVKSREEA